jgi:hypothetical protein
MAVTPPSQPSIKVTYTVPRRGGLATTSNRYFFTGANLTSGQFTALVAALQAEYVLILPTDCTIIGYTQYDAGSEVPVASTSVSVAGTMSLTGRTRMSSDSCAMARFSTSQRTSKNHPIYLFKYWHGTLVANGAAVDVIDPTQLTRYQSFASDIVAGFSDGSSTRHVTGPYGAVALGGLVTQWVHHRDFR